MHGPLLTVLLVLAASPLLAPGLSAQEAAEKTVCGNQGIGAKLSQDIRDAILGSSLFAEAHAQILKNYVREVDSDRLAAAAMQQVCKRYPQHGVLKDEELVKAAIQGMMASLDKHSIYLAAAHLKALRDLKRRRLGGIGIQVKKGEQHFKITSVAYAMPGEKAGLRVGDHIIGIDSKPLDGLLRHDVWLLLHGEPDSAVVLTLERGDSGPFELTLKRRLTNRIGAGALNMGDIGYLRIYRFSERVVSDVATMIRPPIRMMVGPNLKGVVVDLRGNPGGLFGNSIKVSNFFLESGRMVTVRGRNSEKHFDAASGDLLKGLPVVVLTDKATQGAAEILAGALKDNGRAVLVGERTFGMGAEETIIPLSDQNALHLTTSKYFRPSGKPLDDGIEPDHVVVNIDDETDEDKPLAFALKLLNEGKVRTAAPSGR